MNRVAIMSRMTQRGYRNRRSACPIETIDRRSRKTSEELHGRARPRCRDSAAESIGRPATSYGLGSDKQVP